MPKIPMLSFSFSCLIVICSISCLLPIANCKAKHIQPLRQSHQTVINFLHQEDDRPKYYWVTLEAEHQSDNFTIAMDSLLGTITSLKAFVNIFVEGKPSSKSDLPQLIIDQPLSSQSLNDFSLAMNTYHLKLSDLSINFQKKFILTQNIFIRIKDDRKYLGEFVDQLQQTILSQNSALNLLSFSTDSIQRFQQISKFHYQQNDPHRESLIQSDEFIKNVLLRAQNHCQSLQMKFQKVLSTKELTFQQIQNQIDNNITQQEIQNLQEIDYIDAFQQKTSDQSYGFVYRLFEIKAKCTGNKPLKQKNAKNAGNRHEPISHDEVTNGADLESKIRRHKKQKIIIN